MSCESTVLQWKNYTPTVSEAFQRLYEDTAFTDVTVACEDNKKIEAHKVILNMCSTLFSNILKDNPNPHPLIYLQGVTIDNLILLKKFMYNGKATVLKQQLDSFMKLSKTFLNSNQESTSADNFKVPPECKRTFEKEISAKNQNINPPIISNQNEEIKDLEEITNDTLGNHLKGGNMGDNLDPQHVDARLCQKKLSENDFNVSNVIFPHCLLLDWHNTTKRNT